MTPAEIQTAMDAIKTEFLPGLGWAHASIYRGLASASAYDDRSQQIACGEGDDWDTAFANLRSALIAKQVEMDAGLVRKMALSIIDLTDSGVCDIASLVKAGFTRQQIDRVGAQACEQAAKMTAVESYSIHSDMSEAAE